MLQSIYTSEGALYKCGEEKDWYLTFINPERASSISDQSFTSSSGTTVKVESLDKRRVRFRVHWFPFHMKGGLVEDYMEQYGSNIELTCETQNFDGIHLKTGTMTGNMSCTERQYSSLPYRGNINGRVILNTVFDAVTWPTRGQPLLLSTPAEHTLQLLEENRREMN